MARFTGTLSLDAGSVADVQIVSNAAIGVEKLKHAYAPGTNFGCAIGATPATREEVVHVANAAGVIRGFRALLNDSGTTTSIAFDLKKNGVSILSAPVTIVHGDGDRAVLEGVLADATLAADDVLSISMTVTSSTGAQGPYAWVALAENDAP